VLITDHFPELRTDLVAALATLDVHELTHGCKESDVGRTKRRGAEAAKNSK
jgi:hypothetical protein